MNERLVLAVDGGNSKTDLALVAADGALLSLVRGPSSSPHQVGLEGALALLEELLERAAADAGLDPRARPLADAGRVLLAGADLPEEERALSAGLEERRFAAHVRAANDTFAVLRCGTERGWGVALVCGAGINCLGVAPDGRESRFPALGALSGDWGGGYDVGVAALSAAARSADGRGPLTTLERAVPAHFGLETPEELAEAIHFGRIPTTALAEVAPLVLAEADGDAVAKEIADRVTDEAIRMVTVTLRRLDLARERVDVILGGGLVRDGRTGLTDAIAAGVRAVAPAAAVRALDSPPIVGATLLALDQLGAAPEAAERARAEVGAAADREAMSRG